jgi:hypothetical protein
MSKLYAKNNPFDLLSNASPGSVRQSIWNFPRAGVTGRYEAPTFLLPGLQTVSRAAGNIYQPRQPVGKSDEAAANRGG